jgi:hypothetical protein
MTAKTTTSAVRRLRGAAFWLLVAGVTWVMGFDAAGQATAAAAPTGPSWGEHLDLVQAAIVILFGFAVWSGRAKLDRIEKKFDLLFAWRDQISAQVERLQGEHDVMARGCHNPGRRRDDRSG